MKLSYWIQRLALKQPYHLSFGTLHAFDTAFVKIEDGGRVGFGEVTPLPGYSDETIRSVESELDHILDALGRGAGFQSIIDDLASPAPMVASALACARETWELGAEKAFAQPVKGVIPVAALCAGETPIAAAQAALKLTAAGHTTLKMKIGAADIGADIARVLAVAAKIAPGVTLRLDANQALTYDAAVELSTALADCPVALIEQPFAPDCWQQHARFAEQSALPLMLDESIWTRRDIEHAAGSAQLVKLKLCKHAGMAETASLARLAADLGLGVVFGNGVQSALGNHLEARLYRQMGLDNAAELSGFNKLAEASDMCHMKIAEGALHDAGISDVEKVFATPKTVKTVVFNF